MPLRLPSSRASARLCSCIARARGEIALVERHHAEIVERHRHAARVARRRRIARLSSSSLRASP
jgi:hypothetical protein